MAIITRATFLASSLGIRKADSPKSLAGIVAARLAGCDRQMRIGDVGKLADFQKLRAPVEQRTPKVTVSVLIAKPLEAAPSVAVRGQDHWNVPGGWVPVDLLPKMEANLRELRLMRFGAYGDVCGLYACNTVLNIIARGEIRTLGDLLDKSEKDYASMRGVAKTSVTDLQYFFRLIVEGLENPDRKPKLEKRLGHWVPGDLLPEVVKHLEALRGISVEGTSVAGIRISRKLASFFSMVGAKTLEDLLPLNTLLTNKLTYPYQVEMKNMLRQLVANFS